MKNLKEKKIQNLKDIELNLELSDELSFSNQEPNTNNINRSPANEELLSGDKVNTMSDKENKNVEKSYITQKEFILKEELEKIPSVDVEELIKAAHEEEKYEKKETGSDEISRLNPHIETLTEKDPDEIIILPNEELRKKYNKSNRNQPL